MNLGGLVQVVHLEGERERFGAVGAGGVLVSVLGPRTALLLAGAGPIVPRWRD